MTQQPNPPIRTLPDSTWQHAELYGRVREAIFALPAYFTTPTTISGINATEIFTLSAALGATIEDQTVATLNAMRPIWDPDDQYQLYHFVRQPQVFPDVLLMTNNPIASERILLGIELKGWYILSKEQEPSFRYTVSSQACNPQDMIVVVPWLLSNVVAGSPKVFAPFVESAKYAADYRNHHWTYVRESKSDPSIVSPAGVNPYPPKSAPISDKPASDSGNNFGRIARTGLLDAFIKQTSQEMVLGIPAELWQRFFRALGGTEATSIATQVNAFLASLEAQVATPQNEAWQQILAGITTLLSEE
jgi:hypothetical protein